MRVDSQSLVAEDMLPHEVRRDHPPEGAAVVAMDALEQATRICRHLLIGTGAGAHGAFHSALRDRRVAGIALINPHDFVGDAAWSAMVLVQRYMQRSSRSMRSWINLMNGRADYQRILSTLSGRMMSWMTGKDVVAKARAQAVATSMLALIQRGCRVVCLVSDNHSSLDHTMALFGTLHHRDFQSHIIRGADHLMRAPQQREEAIEHVVAWAVRTSALPNQVDGTKEDPADDLGSDEMAGDRRA